MLVGIIAILIAGAVLYSFFGILGIIIPLVLLVVLVVALFKKSAKEVAETKAKELAQKQCIEDHAHSHPEFGNYNQYSRTQGVYLVVYENGYFGYFEPDNTFKCDKVQKVKSLKYVTEPFDKNTQKTIGIMGKILYRFELDDFSNPIVDLQFGTYTNTADKVEQKKYFDEVKANLGFAKRNAGTTKDTSNHFDVNIIDD